MAYHTKKNRHIWLSVLSGILLWFVWPATIFGFLLHLAFIPLLIIESELTNRYYRRPALRYFLSLFLTFLVWYILSVLSANVRDVTFLSIFINSCLMTIPMMLFFLTKRASGQIAGYFSFIIYWIAFEYLMLHWNIRGPWPIIGNGFASLPYLIQWYEITGSQGGSLWILCCNLILFQTIKSGNINPLGVALFSFLFILPSGASVVRYLTYPISGQSAEITIIYPGAASNPVSHNKVVLRDQKNQIDVVIQYPYTHPDKMDDSSSKSKECRHFDVKPITRTFIFSNHLLFSQTGKDKYNANSKFVSSNKYNDVLKSADSHQRFICTKNSLHIGIMSGNELISGEAVTAYIRKGIRLVFFITEGTAGQSHPKLHSQYARLRSIETRRDIILSSETALASYVNQKGSYIKSPETGDHIRLNSGETFYVKYGDYIGISSFYFALICIFILLGGLLVKRTNFI